MCEALMSASTETEPLSVATASVVAASAIPGVSNKGEDILTPMEYKIGADLSAYLDVLAQQVPGVFTFRTGSGRIFRDLLIHWPVLGQALGQAAGPTLGTARTSARGRTLRRPTREPTAEPTPKPPPTDWEDEAQELCHRITDAIYPLAGALYAQAVEISVNISFTPVLPPEHVDALSVYVAFDAKKATERHAFLSPHAPSLSALGPPAHQPSVPLPSGARPPTALLPLTRGVAVLCRPLNYRYHTIKDDRKKIGHPHAGIFELSQRLLNELDEQPPFVPRDKIAIDKVKARIYELPRKLEQFELQHAPDIALPTALVTARQTSLSALPLPVQTLERHLMAHVTDVTLSPRLRGYLRQVAQKIRAAFPYVVIEEAAHEEVTPNINAVGLRAQAPHPVPNPCLRLSLEADGSNAHFFIPAPVPGVTLTPPFMPTFVGRGPRQEQMPFLSKPSPQPDLQKKDLAQNTTTQPAPAARAGLRSHPDPRPDISPHTESHSESHAEPHTGGQDSEPSPGGSGNKIRRTAKETPKPQAQSRLEPRPEPRVVRRLEPRADVSRKARAEMPEPHEVTRPAPHQQRNAPYRYDTYRNDQRQNEKLSNEQRPNNLPRNEPSPIGPRGTNARVASELALDLVAHAARARRDKNEPTTAPERHLEPLMQTRVIEASVIEAPALEPVIRKKIENAQFSKNFTKHRKFGGLEIHPMGYYDGIKETRPQTILKAGLSPTPIKIPSPPLHNVSHKPLWAFPTPSLIPTPYWPTRETKK
jgi:hypothetical protein